MITGTQSYQEDKEQTLYAYWKRATYYITFHDNTTYLTTKQAVLYNTPTKLTKNGKTQTYYQFDSWNTKENGSGNRYEDEGEITITENIDLYLIWTPKLFTITFNTNVNGQTIPEQTGKYGVTFKLDKINFDNPGYDFKGWVDSSSYTTYADGSNISLTKDITLVANWTAKSYTDTFWANFSSNEKITTKVRTYGNSGTIANPPSEPTRINYNFIGWYDEQLADNECITTKATNYTNIYTRVYVAKDLNLYAAWRNLYDVTFYYNDKTYNNETIGETIMSPYKLPKDPIREGYIFSGWYTKQYVDDADLTKYTPVSKITTSNNFQNAALNNPRITTLYAYWKTKTYEVKILNGYNQISTTTIKEGTIINNKNDDLIKLFPNIDNYALVNLYTDQALTTPVTFPYTVKENATLYATLGNKIIKYTANYEETEYTISGYQAITAQTSIQLSPYYRCKPVTSIDQQALSNRYISISSLQIPDTIESIGYRAFYGINNFSYAPTITSINLGKNLKTIGNEAFAVYGLINCALVIPDSITSIGRNIFNSGYTTITSLSLPNKSFDLTNSYNAPITNSKAGTLAQFRGSEANWRALDSTYKKYLAYWFGTAFSTTQIQVLDDDGVTYKTISW